MTDEPEASCRMDETFNSFTDDELKVHDVQINKKLELIEQKIGRLKAQKAQLLQWQDTIQNVRVQRRTNQQTERNWEDETFAWSAEIRKKLQEVFSLRDFRPQQLKAINALLSGNDVLLLAPTGGGKSLCFQLPALTSKGVTVVISPLISLMEDQMSSLKRLNIEARMLCSSNDKNSVNQIQKDLAGKDAPIMKLLYVTPERMAKSKRFMTALQKCYYNGNLDRFAIDEVHCCSQWGHDFRPDYKYLGVLKELFPKIPLLGVTATATPKVIADVQKMLNIPESLLFVAKFNRPNLYYHVLSKPLEKSEQYELLSSLMLDRFRNKSGIIYTFSTRDAVDISTELRQRGLKVAPYHANLESADRTKIHQLWQRNELQAVVATVAFGMGIDKPDVRFVIHHTMSKSLENYYQESGRAGRDGRRAECVLLYHFSDMFRISTMTFSEHNGLQNAYAMVDYCINVSDCRRMIISRYFSETWGESDCNAMCDRCANIENALNPNVDIIPLLAQLTRVISTAIMQDMKLTGLKLVDACLHKGPTVLRSNDPPPPYGRAVLEQIVAFLIINGHLKESFTYTPYATLSYICQGTAAIPTTLLLRVGKLLDLPQDSQETQIPAPANRKKNQKKRTLREVAGQPAKKIIKKTPAKKSKSALFEVTSNTREETITSTTSHNGHQEEYDDDDVEILPANEEIIEIDVD